MMRIFTTAEQAPRIHAKRQPVWAIWLVFGLLSGPALAQIDVNETGLHDANSVYGIDGSAYMTPWTNGQSITLFASGETDPNLYSNVSFNAYGIYSSVGLTNNGQINVTGTGGSAYGIEGTAFASIYIYGLYGLSDVTNTAAIGIDATGGSPTADLGNASAAT